MGTKLQPPIDILATKSIFIASEIRDSMERTLQQRSLEAVKTTMLKQEEIFKQQLRELHRLYSAQRMLMDELKNKTNAKGRGGIDFDIARRSDHQEDITAIEAARPSSSCSVIKPGSLRTAVGLEEESCGVDLTLSLGGDSRKRLKEYQPYQCIGLGCSDAVKSDQKSQDQHPSMGAMRSSTGIPTNIRLDQAEEKRSHWSF